MVTSERAICRIRSFTARTVLKRPLFRIGTGGREHAHALVQCDVFSGQVARLVQNLQALAYEFRKGLQELFRQAAFAYVLPE
jgi:hypothetical protein